MKVGSGMIGAELIDTEGDIYYAAGVANSACVDSHAFRRDRERLLAHIRQPGRIVYISTTSNANSEYVQHKRTMEDIVRRRGNYIICRLPIVAGRSDNAHTLLNNLWSSIINDEPVRLIDGARRNVIDVKDVALLVRHLARQPASDRTVDVGGHLDWPVKEIADTLAERAGKSPDFITVSALPGVVTEHGLSVDWVRDSGVVFLPNYLRRTIARYYP
jgi:nucleoside-diphosphate-sugar epimerase